MEEDIFSFLIVDIYHYMNRPIYGLDPCFSEFRAKEIKSVPVLRIFGSTSDGIKTCLHIHGVLPYFYIPYEGGTKEVFNKFAYQLCEHLDKALNISLGQSTSQAHHIFKVKLVKAFPFYGYHRKEHLFLKIYMYNPRLLKRAANLLQNGALNGKSFQAFDAHVPYRLQFLIDYNLFPMSFLHVKINTIKVRRSDDIAIKVKLEQILSRNIEKISTSRLEIDINAANILNRIHLQKEMSAGKKLINPGIESIWQDEDVRRKLLKESQNIELPVLEIDPPDERFNIRPTDSDVFYRAALERKLVEYSSQTSNTTSDNTTILTPNKSLTFSPDEKKRKFNVTKLLKKSIYPEECTPDDDFLNGTIVENHINENESACTTNLNILQKNIDESIFDEDTLTEEDIINLSQHPFKNLNDTVACEQGVLEYINQLDREENDEPGIDMDSTLAPYSQTEENHSKEVLEFLKQLDDDEEDIQEHISNLSQIIQSESEDECLNDYTIANEDIEEVLAKLTQSQKSDLKNLDNDCIPQFDGADQDFNTPKKHNRSPSHSISSHTRSPRTPKSAKRNRYAPLKGIQTFSPKLIKIDESDSDSEAVSASSDETYNPSNSIYSRKKKRNILRNLKSPHAFTPTKRSSRKSADHDDICPSSPESNVRKNYKSKESLDKTVVKITCNLKNPKEMKDTNSLKMQKCAVKLGKLSPPNNINFNSLKIQKCAVMLAKRSPPNNINFQVESPKDIDKTKEKKIRSQFCEKYRSIISSDNETDSEKNTIIIKPVKAKSSDKNVNDEYLTTVKEPKSTSKKSALEILNGLKLNENLKSKIQIFDKKHKNTSNSKPVVQQHVFESLKELGLCFLDQPKSQNVANLTPNLKKDSEMKTNNLKTFKIKMCKVKIRRLNINKKRHYNHTSNTVGSVKEHDKKLNYSPLPGSSKNYLIHSKSQTPLKKRKISQEIINQEFLKEVQKLPEESVTNDFNLKNNSQTLAEDEDDLNIYSFYETSLTINDSPSMFSDIDSFSQMHLNRLPQKVNENIQETCEVPISSKNSDLESIRSWGTRNSMSPLQFSEDNSFEEIDQQGSIAQNNENLSQSINEILQNLPVYVQPEVVNIMPFYSNPDDVRKSKEIGHLALHIPLLNQQNSPSNQLKESSGMNKNAEICETTSGIDNEIELGIEDDSPIKIRRQKIAMILNEDDNEIVDCDKTLKSIEGSSLTPQINVSVTETNKKSNKNLLIDEGMTPKSSKTCKVSLKKLRLDNVVMQKHSSDKKLKFQKELFKDNSLSNSPQNQDANVSNIKCVPIEVLLSDDVNVEDAIALKQSNSTDEFPTQIVFTDLNKKNNVNKNSDTSFGLSGASLNNTYGFKRNLENLQQAKADVDHNYLTTMSLEVFVKTRHNLHPNPVFDEICGVFYAILNDVPENTKIPTKVSGYILLAQSNDKNPKLTGIEGDVKIVMSEEGLFDVLLELVRYWDPDILAGYEVELNSWGYILDRSKALKTNFIQLLSRVPSQKVYENFDDDEPKETFTDLDHESKIYGRILLDVWRLLRSEIALTSYSFENVMYHILHRRIPAHSYQKLTEWYLQTQTRWIVLEYYLERVNGVMELLDQLDLIGRTSEMAKLIGIQFYEILSRGSQYRVESMMLRIAKPKNLIPMSPSPQQRLHMRAPEYLPLILEPQSRFYADPLIVLDFQSLYPSIMIAYNYCFSTCLGRVEYLGSSSPFEFGVSMLKVSPTMLRKLLAYDMITISPCGAVFVKQEIREGVLPQMVREILDTRIMVKKSMKLHKTNQVLQRVLHSRQLALKLMANVTYGYTAANFSGRMPCVEVGDSVVAKGRETLERAIKLIEATPRWGVEVVYGDTDSIFVLCPGKTRETSFKIGEEIAEAVTKDNPFPVKLKLEKVYQPSILQTKKRYVGFMYETPDQIEPIYEAKGIETVRRDGCPAVAKILEKSLRILFQTKDVSKVKQYVCRQFTKILQNKANIQDLIFAKEFRGRFGYKPTACVPALELTRKWMLTDPRKEPRRGERVPYIVTNGPPGLPIIRLIRCPHDVLNNEGLKINAIYYITRAIIPALNRCFLLIGVDINEWFAELPRKNSQLLQFFSNNKNDTKYSMNKKKMTISQYFSSSNCVIDCGKQTKSEICKDCIKDIPNCIITLKDKIFKLERSYYLTKKICQSCTGRPTNIDCRSLDCPVLFVKDVKKREYKQVSYYNEIINKII